MLPEAIVKKIQYLNDAVASHKKIVFNSVERLLRFNKNNTTKWVKNNMLAIHAISIRVVSSM